jgi:hypothetical protein
MKTKNKVKRFPAVIGDLGVPGREKTPRVGTDLR